MVNNKRFICEKSFSDEELTNPDPNQDFKSICSLKIFREVLFVGDSCGGLSVLCLKEISSKLEDFVLQRRTILGMQFGNSKTGNRNRVFVFGKLYMEEYR